MTVRPTTQRVFFVCVLIFITSTVGAALGLIFEWPAQLDRGSGKPNITAEEVVVNGTLTSLPVGPWLALTVFALLARSRHWWGTVSVGALCLLGVMFFFGGLGEALAPPTPFVPRAVLIVAGVVYGGLGLALVVSGIADLRDRMQARRPSHPAT